MKKIIDGKVYNTETADVLAEWESGHLPNDFGYYREILMKTKKGAYFLYGEGGALSPYSISVGNNGRGGSADISKLTADEVVEWLEEKRIDSEDVLNEFKLEEA